MKRIATIIMIIIQLTLIPLVDVCPVSAETTNDVVTNQTSEVDTLVNYQEDLYKNAIKQFNKISTKKLYKLINNSKKMTYVFWGKKTCPFCRAFAPKLASISKQRHIKIYYINTINTDSNCALRKARKKFGITEVPALLKIRNRKKLKILDRTKTNIERFLTSTY